MTARTILQQQMAAPAPHRGFKHRLLRVGKCWQLYVLLLPAVLYFAIFHYAPMYGLQIAFRKYSGVLGITGSPWVGLTNINRFIRMPEFGNILGNTLELSITSLLFNFPMPILLALLLNECRSTRFKKIAQNLTYAPYFISTVVLVGMMVNFLSPSIGVINKFIGLLGGNAVEFMAKPQWFRPVYILSSMWQRTGWASIVYLAALSGVDPDLHEAAQIDGASRLQRIWHVNLPSISPTVITMLILSCGQIMSVGFEKAYLMQNALNLSESEIIATYVYKTGLLGAQYSFTTAVGLFNSLLNFAIIFVANTVSRRVSNVSLW